MEPSPAPQAAEGPVGHELHAPSIYRTSRAKESFTREQYSTLVVAPTATGDEAFTTVTPSSYFIVMLRIGARPGEVDALLWKQVDVVG